MQNHTEDAEVRGSRPAVRHGRPRREDAWAVEKRILDAATKVFLDRGFEGASVGEIAREARAGKPSIYARFPGKNALFTAVVERHIQRNAHFEEAAAASDLPLEVRLRILAKAIAGRAIASDSVGLMRVAIAESHRFPDLAREVHRMARERGNEAVASVLGEIARSGGATAWRAFASDRLAVTTRRFTEVTVMPLVLRVLFGERPEGLAADLDPHVEATVAFFLDACRASGSGA